MSLVFAYGSEGQDGTSLSDSLATLPHKKTPSGRTRMLRMHYTWSQTDQPDPTEIAYLQFFARTAIQLGLQLEIWTNAASLADLKQLLAPSEYQSLAYEIVASQTPVLKWAEDYLEYLDNGQIAVLSQFDQSLLERAMRAGRQARWRHFVLPAVLAEALRDDPLWIPLGVSVNASRTAVELNTIAQSTPSAVRRLRAYIEGGNMITGEDATGTPLLLVGRDAIATTAYLDQLDEDEVRRVIGEDFGLETIDRVIAVEQPGQFHLDMGLLFLGNGVVAVNDSSQALKDAIECAETVPCMTTETMAAKQNLQYQLEVAAAQDLEAAGLEVRRVELAAATMYNFCNGEFVEGQNGDHYYITNGGPAEQEARFEALMVSEWQVVKQVIFSPSRIAQKSLQERGGVGCRIKGKPS